MKSSINNAMIITGSVTLVVFFILGVNQCCIKNRVCSRKKVATVGGCDKDGLCGIGYDDGTFGRQYLPAIGKEVEVCR